MALFNFGKKKKDAPKLPKKATQVVAAPVKDVKTIKATNVSGAVGGRYAHVLIRPRITEKATDVTANSVYVFEIDPRSDKRAVREAVRAQYNVNPIKINIVKLPAKRVVSKMRGGHPGATAAIKKAYVYLPKGTTIEVA